MSELQQTLQRFLTLKNNVEANEAIRARADKELKELYPLLVEYCPHPEAIDHKYGRSGVFRVCTTCGLEDHASQGGTPGDEYNYGYPGSPNREFWAGTEVRVADNEAEHWKYRRQHGFRVSGGKVTKGLLV